MTTLAHRRANLAVLFALTAYALYSTGDAIAKVLVTHHYAPGLMMTFNGLFICTASLLWLTYRGQVHVLWQTPHLVFHLIRAGLVGILSLIIIAALKYVPLADYYGIIFMTPFLTVLFARLIFREEIGWHRLIAILVGFGGVLLLTGPVFDHFNIGYVLTAAAAFLMAGHVMVVRKLAGKDPLPLGSFFPGLGMLIVGIPLLSFDPQLPTLNDSGLFLGFGLSLWLGQLFFAQAFALTPLTSIIAPYIYSQMLWGLFYGFMLFGAVPSPVTVAGAMIVIASGLFMVLVDLRLRRRRMLGGTVPAAD